MIPPAAGNMERLCHKGGEGGCTQSKHAETPSNRDPLSSVCRPPPRAAIPSAAFRLTNTASIQVSGGKSLRVPMAHRVVEKS